MESGTSHTRIQKIKIRNNVAFWILGLCNNYGYVLMLSAAHDILTEPDYNGGDDGFKRKCNRLPTSAILLADIIPCLIIKIVSPFFPMKIHFRMTIILICSILGYILVGLATGPKLAIPGVVLTSLSSGLGEASILAYTAFLGNKNSISTWSSGTGAAGFFGAISYALLAHFMSRSTIMYVMISVPVLMGVSFWIILKHENLEYPPILEINTNVAKNSTSSTLQSDTIQPITLADKIRFLPQLVKYMLPLGLVYLFEYFINQGLVELIQFNMESLKVEDQYRWYQADYQIGVFISRSSVNLYKINKIWLLALLQGFNVIFFTTEAIFQFLPHIFWILLFIFFEGLLGGAAYVNTFDRISAEVNPCYKEFALGITSLADSFGITIAGFLSIPVHNAICRIP